MVVLSKSYLQNFEKSAIKLAFTFGIAHNTFRRYVDDFHALFGSRNNTTELLNALKANLEQSGSRIADA